MITWISVKERLPERNTNVLIFARGVIDVGYLNNRPLGNSPLWWGASWVSGYEYDIEWCVDYDNDVTHWAELPKGPVDVQ